jgi:hypothetical protein
VPELTEQFKLFASANTSDVIPAVNSRASFSFLSFGPLVSGLVITEKLGVDQSIDAKKGE